MAAQHSVSPHVRALVAACGAAVMLLIAGFGFRALGAYLDNYSVNVRPPLSGQELQGFPLNFAAWLGTDVPLEERLRAATDAEALLNRTYVRTGGEGVSLYIAYGTRPRELAPHRPEVCYPGAGWTLASEVKKPLKSGSLEIPCRLLRFVRGGFGEREMIVVNYYVVDGIYSHNVNELRVRNWKVGYVAQVQIACATNAWRDAAAAEELASDFARDALGPLHELLVTRGTPGAAGDEVDQ